MTRSLIQLGGQALKLDADGDTTIQVSSDDVLVVDTAGNEALKIDATGAITKPLQPAFQVSVNSADTNFAINTFHTATFGSEVFDQNNDFASNTFTAPVTGRYQLNLIGWFEDVASSADYLQLEITTSNTRYYGIIDGTGFDGTVTFLTLPVCVLADMDANDTATVRYYQSGGDQQIDLGTATTFSGYLVA